MDSLSPTIFTKNHSTSWKSESEIMSPVEAIGDRMIKRFASAIEQNSKKISKSKITTTEKSSSPHGVANASFEEDKIGLREDYKRLLESNKGFPWEQISMIPRPHIQELLISLFLLEKCSPSTIAFAFALAKASNTRVLGELLFLADRFPKLEISVENFESSIQWIHHNFHEELNKVVHSLHKHYLSHKKTNVQSPEIALMTQLAVELAKLLLTEKGAVNFAIIPSLIEFYVDEPLNPINHEVNIIYTFQQLLHSPKIREKIARITKPESPISPSNLVIRAVLDLPVTMIPTDLHAQQTALSGLLSHIRQGTDGSCFATPLAMGLLSSHIELCLDDFSCLLSKGKLTRKIHNATKDFPYLLRMNNKSLNTEITLTCKGEVVLPSKEKVFIWQIPGFIKVCGALNEKEPELLLSKILPHFFDEKSADSRIVTTRHVLQELSKIVARKRASSTSEVGLIFSSIYFAFEGQVCNPLLGVWENSIAGMAEGDEGSLVTSTIINTTVNTLNEKMKEIAPNEKAIRKRIKAEIKSILLNRIQLHYDPMIHHSSLSKDQHTTEGAFVLYDKGEYDRSTSWIRVDDPKEYSAFVSRVIEKAKQYVSSHAPLFDKLLNYAVTEEFLLKVLSQYFNKHPNIPRSLSQYKRLKYTPWVTKSGNNFSKVIQVYFEFPQTFHSTIVTPQTPLDLFYKLTQYASNLSLPEKGNYLENPYRCISARIPGVHAFSLMLGHPTFYQAWANKNDLEKWIHEKTIIPGQKIAGTLIPKDLKKKMVDFVLENFITDDQKNIFNIHIARMKKNLTIQEFRNTIVRLADLSGKPLQLFDSHLYLHLPGEFQKILNESAIHFADTNWSDGLNDLHFCFVFNPGSGDLEIWAAHDDQNGLQALDQPLWLQEWEIFNC